MLTIINATAAAAVTFARANPLATVLLGSAAIASYEAARYLDRKVLAPAVKRLNEALDDHKDRRTAAKAAGNGPTIDGAAEPEAAPQAA